MIGTLIIYVATGECCNFIPGLERPPEGSGQRREFAHVYCDLEPEISIAAAEKKLLLVDIDETFGAQMAAELRDNSKPIPVLLEVFPISWIDNPNPPPPPPPTLPREGI